MKSKILSTAAITLGSALLTLIPVTQASAATLTLSAASCTSFTTTSTGSDLTVTCNAATVNPTPTCTLQANPTSLAASGPVTITATCSSVDANTTYSWVGAQSSTNTATITIGQTTQFTVTATNANGSGPAASVTVPVGAVSPPVCTVSAASPSITLGSSTNLTATCTNSPTSYTWTGGVAGSGAIVTATPSVTTNYTVTATNAGGTSAATAVQVTVTPPVTTEVPAFCGNLAVTHVPMRWNEDNGAVYYNRSMTHGQAHIYSFTTGPADGIASFSIAEYAGSVPTRTVVISPTPCDFSVTNAALPKVVGTSGTGYFSNGTIISRRITLQPNTKYYVNIKNENPYSNPGIDACGIGENCGYRFNLNHSGK